MIEIIRTGKYYLMGNNQKNKTIFRESCKSASDDIIVTANQTIRVPPVENHSFINLQSHPHHPHHSIYNTKMLFTFSFFANSDYHLQKPSHKNKGQIR